MFELPRKKLLTQCWICSTSLRQSTNRVIAIRLSSYFYVPGWCHRHFYSSFPLLLPPTVNRQKKCVSVWRASYGDFKFRVNAKAHLSLRTIGSRVVCTSSESGTKIVIITLRRCLLAPNGS